MPQETKSQSDLNKKVAYRLGLAFKHFTGITNHKYKTSVQKGAPTWRILRYEQIIDPKDHYYPIPENRYVKPYTFKRQMAYLSKHCNVVSLEELIEKIEKGEKLPLKTVAITFDGGWLDFKTTALPTLNRYGLPASLFVATSFVGGMLSYWQDMLMLCMLTLYNQGVGLQHIEGLAEFFEDLPEPESPPEPLQKCVERIGQLIDTLKAENHRKRLEVLGLFEAPVEHVGGVNIARSFLNWEEIAEILANTRMSLGSMGHLHNPMTELSPGEISADIRKSYDVLRAHSVRPIKAFTYPEGLTSKEARKVLKDVGIDHSLALGKFAAPKAGGKKPAIYGRIPVFEGNSFCTEFFTSLLWGS